MDIPAQFRKTLKMKMPANDANKNTKNFIITYTLKSSVLNINLYNDYNMRMFFRWITTELNLNKDKDKIIDVGCGNAMTLVELAKKGFTNLMGVDYSLKAVDLARMVLNDNDLPNVKVEVCDILDDTLPHDFKVVHDKGTYDAISLNPEDPTEKREKYIENVYRILLPQGYLVLTSCNWTKEELLKHFTNR